MASKEPFRDLTMADAMLEFYDGPHATPPPADEGPIYLGIKNMTEAGSLDLSTIRHVSMADFPRWTKRVTPQGGDLVFTYEATLHRYALIPEAFEGCLGRRVALVRPRRDVVDPKFLLFYMLSPEWRETVEDRVITGATVDRIPLVDFPTFPVRLPSLSLQHRIAGVLGAFDTLIEINERRIELLEDFARTLYREWFVHFRYPGHTPGLDAAPAPVPEGWRVRALGELIEINRDTIKASELPDPVDYLDISSVGNGNLKASKPMGAAEAPSRARRRVADGDVVWSTVRPNRKAHCVIHDPAPNLIASTGLAVLSPVGVPSSFLFEYASSEVFSSYLSGRATGSAYPAVRPEDFAAAPVILPPKEFLDRFDSVVDPVLRLRTALQRQSTALSFSRDLLLPRLVTGQLDISDIDLGVLTPAESK